VQTISGRDLEILDIVARYPGSSHDSFIFNNSKLCERFENNEFGNGILLGDGGYALKPYLMIPLRKPSNETEMKYNKAHISTRNTVERQYGVWKRRFPCLSLGLRLKVETTAIVIVACAVLHNFCIQRKESLPYVDYELETLISQSNSVIERDTEEINSATNSIYRRAKMKEAKFIEYFRLLNNSN
jgi:hypothetical protein